MSNTEINKVLDGVVDYLYSFSGGGDCCPSHDDAQSFNEEMERVKELIAEKDAEIAALKQQDNWIPIEDDNKPELAVGTKGIIQTNKGNIYLCIRCSNNYSWVISESDGHDCMGELIGGNLLSDYDETPLYYQPLPEAKK